MHIKQKIAFIKYGNFSYINTNVLQILVSNFPDFQVDVVELGHLINEEDRLAIFYCLKEYGKDILLRKRSISDTFIRTPYFFKKIKTAVQKSLADQHYAFTFQT